MRISDWSSDVCSSDLARAAVPESRAAGGVDEIFGDSWVDDPGFGEAGEPAYRDPLLRPKRTQSHWQKRDREKRPPPQALPFPWLAKAIAFVGEFGLWLLLGGLLVLLAATAKRWLPWLRSGLEIGSEHV